MAKTKNTKEKMFIVTKIVMAKSIYEALKKEKNVVPTDVYIDQDWKKNNL